MPLIRTWQAEASHGAHKLTINFECPFYEELLYSNGGMLSRNFEAHALWDYYGCALQSQEKAKKNLVYEDDLSIRFDHQIARQLFIAKANQHGVPPAAMVQFWPMIMRQRIALGGKDELPEWAIFRYWGN